LIVVHVRDAAGRLVADGTEVFLATDRGTLHIAVSTTRGGLIAATLSAGHEPGMANVTATAGESAGSIQIELQPVEPDTTRVGAAAPHLRGDPDLWDLARRADPDRRLVHSTAASDLSVTLPDYAATFGIDGLSLSAGDRLSVGLQLLEVRAGSQVLFVRDPSRPPRVAAQGDSVQIGWTANVVEALHVLDEGVEQTFLFNRVLPPGDVTVRLHLTSTPQGVMYPQLASPEEGVTFYTADGRERLTLGAAVAYDAGGRATVADMALARGGEELVVTISGEWLSSATYPVTLDPVLGDPFAVGASGGGTVNQQAPAVAFDTAAGEYLVVWQDGRAGTSWDVYGQRLTPW
jgi:hypothetical protein